MNGDKIATFLVVLVALLTIAAVVTVAYGTWQTQEHCSGIMGGDRKPCGPD